MSKPLVEDELWEEIAPLLPAAPAKPKGGRPRVSDRAALTGILFVLKTGLPWEMLPPRDAVRQWHDLLASAQGMARSGRLASVARAVAVQAAPSRATGLVARPRGLVLGASGRRLFKQREKSHSIGPNPTDRARPGTKHHRLTDARLTDARGVPLAMTTTGANRPDITQLLPLLDAMAPVQGRRGRPRRQPHKVLGDRGYCSQPHREELRRRGIIPRLARRNTPHGSGLGRERWPIERTFSWLHNARRLRVRFDRLDSIHEAFLRLQLCLICYCKLRFC